MPLLPIPNPPAVLPAAVPPLVPCPPSLLFPLHPIGRCPPPASPLSSSYILLPASSPFRRSSVLLLPSPSPARLCHRGVSFVRPFASLPSPPPSRMPRPSSLRLSPFASSASPLPPLDPCLPPPPSASRPSPPSPHLPKMLAKPGPDNARFIRENDTANRTRPNEKGDNLRTQVRGQSCRDARRRCVIKQDAFFASQAVIV